MAYLAPWDGFTLANDPTEFRPESCLIETHTAHNGASSVTVDLTNMPAHFLLFPSEGLAVSHWKLKGTTTLRETRVD